jgi:hypothetical protein
MNSKDNDGIRETTREKLRAFREANGFTVAQSTGAVWERAREAFLLLEYRTGRKKELPGLERTTEAAYAQAGAKLLADKELLKGGQALVEQAKRELPPHLYNALAEVMGASPWLLQLGRALKAQRYEVHLAGQPKPVKIGGNFYRVLKAWATSKAAKVNKRETVSEGMARLGQPCPEPAERTKRGGTYLCPPGLLGKIGTL